MKVKNDNIRMQIICCSFDNYVLDHIISRRSLRLDMSVINGLKYYKGRVYSSCKINNKNWRQHRVRVRIRVRVRLVLWVNWPQGKYYWESVGANYLVAVNDPGGIVLDPPRSQPWPTLWHIQKHYLDKPQETLFPIFINLMEKTL